MRFKVSEDTAVYGVSELRTKTPELLKTIGTHRVILTKRNKPVGVVLTYEEYEHLEHLIEALEDRVLGEVAKTRDQPPPPDRYLSWGAFEHLVARGLHAPR